MVESTTLTVHRCRFVDFSPSPITALAFPPLPLPSFKGKIPATKNVLKFGTLAVGHANGNIDLCEWTGSGNKLQSPQAWAPKKILSGPYPSKVDSIAFAIRWPDERESDLVPDLDNLRLFSSGGGSELLEWDIEKGTVRRTINSQGGSIWCMAVNPASSTLALGCEDGTVRLISLENDDLRHSRRFDRVKTRILSIAWGPPQPRQIPLRADQTGDVSSDDDDDDDEDSWKDVWLVTGGSDSSLRKWDCKTGRPVDRMGTDKIKGERTLVWTVGVLGNGTIVSGDSLGMVKFWDSRTCTQLRSFHGHGADVLCMTIAPDGKAVYTAGVDQKITQFILVKTASTNPGSRTSTRWVQTTSRRMHSHDVRALAIWPPYTPLLSSHSRTLPADIAPILASGGLDMSVVLTPAAPPSNTVVKIINPLYTSTDATFDDSYHRRLAYTYPSSGAAVQIARRSRLISCMRDAGVTVWRIIEKSPSNGDDAPEVPTGNQKDNWEKVLEMELNVQTNLIASAVSDDGHWLAVSDLYEAKLFKLQKSADGQLDVRRMREFSSILRAHLSRFTPLTGGAAFQFTPDSSKLIMTSATCSCVLVIDLGTDDDLQVLRLLDHHRSGNSIRSREVIGRKEDVDVEMEGREGEENADYEKKVAGDEPVTHTDVLRIAVSPDGQWLATSDSHGRTHTFNLDSVQHHGVLPSFPQPAQALAFDPTRPGLLLMAFPDNSLYIYDVEARQCPAWARDICNNLPKRLTHSHDPIMGIAFDPVLVDSSGMLPSYALFWGSTWICKLLLNQPNLGGGGKKRRRDNLKEPTIGHEDGTDFKMITHYRPILAVGFVGPQEVVVVERPLVDVLSTLPPAYFKHKYGTS